MHELLERIRQENEALAAETKAACDSYKIATSDDERAKARIAISIAALHVRRSSDHGPKPTAETLCHPPVPGPDVRTLPEIQAVCGEWINAQTDEQRNAARVKIRELHVLGCDTCRVTAEEVCP